MTGYRVLPNQRGKDDHRMISVLANRTVYLNAATMRDFFRGFSYVRIHWDAKTGFLGFEPVKLHGEGSFVIAQELGSDAATISCKGLVKKTGLTGNLPARFLAKWNKRAGLVEIDMSKVLG